MPIIKGEFKFPFFIGYKDKDMKVKEGVNIFGIDMRMRQALIVADRIYKKYGRVEGVTVTSALDGEHSPRSLHYYGLAIDIRTRYFTSEELSSVFDELIVSLSAQYDVILEKTHIHIEAKL